MVSHHKCQSLAANEDTGISVWDNSIRPGLRGVAYPCQHCQAVQASQWRGRAFMREHLDHYVTDPLTESR